ncbi:phosphoglycerate kinase, cytosolic-like isoform X2 [Prosopis cineraria]|uniref:phosphoglycerate kinase, cytosolic-like isoform X2 n=1 Tax=Prosopis cineraria TaxID=364024 RepID=UPI0024106BF8|nr:phosphoglycerate kinase, cytosolic-like isoform X2 [Prosopis cineraria]
MGYLLNLLHGMVFLNKSSFHDGPEWLQHKRCSYTGKLAKFRMRNGALLALQGSGKLAGHDESSINHRIYTHNGGKLNVFPHIQTLREFPKKELSAKVVMVRFDSNILIKQHEQQPQSVSNALRTIKYLHEAGAKVILVSDWDTDSQLSHRESIADFLSEVLQIQILPLQNISSKKLSKIEGPKKPDILLVENLSNFKEEFANCLEFAKELSSGVDIFVNDSFSQSHRVLASTVGVTRFCYACMAGFHFEESLCLLKKVTEATKKPYVAIIGGGDFYNKAAAFRFLTSRCQGLVFVGMMSFQIMHALGVSVPLGLVDLKACDEALHIVQLAQDRNMQILYPKDFWCRNKSNPKQLQAFPSHSILDGWVPVDLGPASLDEIGSLLGTSKKVIWMGPVRFVGSSKYTIGAANLAKMLDQLNTDCEITVVGNMACQVVRQELSSLSVMNLVENASVVWEYLKGRKLPGVMALDRAYPFEINWNDLYADPAQPLFVDIGSGNGVFLLEMAQRRKDLNFLGLEINEKLVRRCLESIYQFGIGNGHFIATNATSTFRSIVSRYPGELILVSIQCPNPDFNKPEHRWRMLQRSLIEAVTDLLTSDGKVFLQSDVEEVAIRMKEQFLRYGKGKLNLVHDQGQCDGRSSWLMENPFGVRSDWERHVLGRGAPMYRLMFSKSACTSEDMGYNYK